MAYFKMTVNKYGTIHVAHLVCYPGVHVWIRDDGTDRKERPGLRKELNWIRRFVRVKRTYKRRIDKLRVDIGLDFFKGIGEE